jgi:hypothetical protein
MKIYRNSIKIKSPDYYRKRYWHKRLEPGENNVGENALSCTVSLISCTSGIKPHVDFESKCWLLVLHNQRYKFEYGTRVYTVNPGDIIRFDLMIYHGLVDVNKGRYLFLGLCIDVDKYCNIDNIDSVTSEFSKHI